MIHGVASQLYIFFLGGMKIYMYVCMYVYVYIHTLDVRRKTESFEIVN